MYVDFFKRRRRLLVQQQRWRNILFGIVKYVELFMVALLKGWERNGEDYRTNTLIYKQELEGTLFIPSELIVRQSSEWKDFLES